MLGVEAKFVSADANTVTLEVAGEQIQLTKGQQAVDVGGLQVSLDSVTDDNVSFAGGPAELSGSRSLGRRLGHGFEKCRAGQFRRMSATQHVQSTASRAANSKPLEYLARGGFIAYGVIHLLVRLAGSAGRASAARPARPTSPARLQAIAKQPVGKFLVILIVVGLVAMAVWQAFEAAIGESGPQDRTAIAERVVSGCRAVLYLYFAYLAYKVVKGANASKGDSQETGASAPDGQARRPLAGRPDRRWWSSASASAW